MVGMSWYDYKAMINNYLTEQENAHQYARAKSYTE
jgi:hypothetical protein